MALSIQDSFLTSTIDSEGVDLDEEQVDELRAWLKEIINRTIEDEAENFTVSSALTLATMSFVAGRAYQTQFEFEEEVEEDPAARRLRVVMEFVEFLGKD